MNGSDGDVQMKVARLTCKITRHFMCVVAKSAPETTEEIAGHVGSLRIFASMHRSPKATPDVLLQCWISVGEPSVLRSAPVATEKEPPYRIIVWIRACLFGSNGIAWWGVRANSWLVHPIGQIPFSGTECRPLRWDGWPAALHLRECWTAFGRTDNSSLKRGRFFHLRHPTWTGRL